MNRVRETITMWWSGGKARPAGHKSNGALKSSASSLSGRRVNPDSRDSRDRASEEAPATRGHRPDPESLEWLRPGYPQESAWVFESNLYPHVGREPESCTRIRTNT